ncbi:hypothetical protein [Streptomyces sp. PSKA30]|uniref:hypothetical protein n=1 Tax=Streptomyces sp. PSKA30 TaxID=2874597 RepID=UPI001CD180D2|nr:hypothetical protein [Streptomyces sp. PSKA30]MBZ9640466.1 hypothetical protein [Streptomyces sp. PSKA30]
MKLRKSLLATAVAVAGLSVPLMASPAAADEMAAGSCSVTGAHGAFTGFFVSSTKIDPLRLRVVDTEADGHHVAVRLVTVENDGDHIAWNWRHYYGGAGGEDTWDTYASSSNGIAAVRVQAGVFEGNDLLKICSSTLRYNPYT